MNNTEDNIKRCEKLTEPQNANWIGISNQMAIARVLARIKELEEPKIIQDRNIRSGKPIIKGTRLTIVDILLLITNFIKDYEKEFRENYADISLKQIIDSINYLLDNSIPKQKVKETVKEVIELIESEQFKIIMGDMTKVGRIKYLLKKLLEEK